MAEGDMSVENSSPKPEDAISDFRVNLNGHRNKKPENESHSYGTNADLPLEASSVMVGPEEFELYETLLIENLGFTREEAGNYCERIADTYYAGGRKDRKNVRLAIRSAFDAFAPTNPEDNLDKFDD